MNHRWGSDETLTGRFLYCSPNFWGWARLWHRRRNPVAPIKLVVAPATEAFSLWRLATMLTSNLVFQGLVAVNDGPPEAFRRRLEWSPSVGPLNLISGYRRRRSVVPEYAIVTKAVAPSLLCSKLGIQVSTEDLQLLVLASLSPTPFRQGAS